MFHRFFGIFEFLRPVYLARSPEFIKKIGIKDSDHFIDHRPFMDRETDDLFANCVIFFNGQKWRDMRATLSPSFTSSKIRLMFDLVAECTGNMSRHLREQSERTGKPVSGDVKEMYARCANDVIASCSFGVQIDSFKDRDNEFFVTGKKFLRVEAWRVVLIRLLPRVSEWFKLKLIRKSVSDYFRTLVLGTMREREEKNIHRPDMINTMMQARKGKSEQYEDVKLADDAYATVDDFHAGKRLLKREWTDNELIAQCFIFFLAGFESSSLIMAALSYEIAIQPEIQERLYAEIKKTQAELNGKPLDYDTLQKMKYFDQVVSETLRKWPPLPITDRYCIKDYWYDDGERRLLIEKGTGISVPIVAFHYDPQYFPNPQRFDPERFSEANKQNIVSGSYMPFGIGPRNCMGNL